MAAFPYSTVRGNPRRVKLPLPCRVALPAFPLAHLSITHKLPRFHVREMAVLRALRKRLALWVGGRADNTKPRAVQEEAATGRPCKRDRRCYITLSAL
jgi:hypothetical protein